MGENRERSKIESESEPESPARIDEPERDGDFGDEEENFIDTEDSFDDDDEFSDSRQDTASSISDAYTARFPFILKDVYLEAKIDQQTRHQTISILKINPDTGNIEHSDSHECIHTVVTVLSTDEFTDIQSDPDRKEAFLKRTVNLRVRDRTARERGEVFEDRGEEEGELFLGIDDQFFAFRSWVQGIAEAGMDAFKVGDEFATASQLQEPIGGMLVRFLMLRDFDFFLQYFDKIVRECRFEGVMHKPSLWANLDVLIENIDPKTGYNYDIAAHERNLNMFVQMLWDLDVDYVFNFLHRMEWRGGKYLIPIIIKYILDRKELMNRPDFRDLFDDCEDSAKFRIQVKQVLAASDIAVKLPEYKNLFSDSNIWVRIFVAENPLSVNYEYYKNLFNDPEMKVRTSVAINLSSVKYRDEYQNLFMDKEKWVREHIPYNSNSIQFNEYHNLFSDKDADVRASVAKYEYSVQFSEYKNLFHDKDWSVRVSVALNPKAAEMEEYRILFRDIHPMVLKSVAINQQAAFWDEYRLLFKTKDFSILKHIAENPNAVHWNEYRSLFKSNNPDVRCRVAKNSEAAKLPEFEKLFDDDVKNIFVGLAQNENAVDWPKFERVIQAMHQEKTKESLGPITIGINANKKAKNKFHL